MSLNGSLSIYAGKSYTITSASNLLGGTIVNAGTLSVAAASGQSNLGGVFTNTGTLSVAANNTLDLFGTSTLKGTLSGAGELWFGFGAQVSVNTNSISVGEIFIAGGNGGGTTTFNVSATYAGVLDFENPFGTLVIASGKTLVLSGTGDKFGSGLVDGGGVIRVTGSADLSTAVGSSGSPTIIDAGTMTQSASVSLHGALQIAYQHSYTIVSGGDLGGASAVITNSGTFTDNSVTGASRISGTFTNNGIVVAQSGALIFNTQMLGTGQAQIEAGGYLEIDAASSASQYFRFDGANAVLGLGDAAAFHSQISKFGAAANEAIFLIGFDSNATESFQTLSGGLQVDIADGAHSASLTFTGNYNQNNFHLGAGSNGQLLTYGA